MILPGKPPNRLISKVLAPQANLQATFQFASNDQKFSIPVQLNFPF